jgi:signal transduction histidine kinase
MKSPVLLTIEIRTEQDVVFCRQRARQVAAQLQFGHSEQTGFATSVSEIARNAFRYAGGGKAEFWLTYDDRDGHPMLAVRISDRGPGIQNLQQILDGQFRSATGMGIGIAGTRRLADQFKIESVPGGGTAVFIARRLPRRAPTINSQLVSALTAELAQGKPKPVFDEVQQQNAELLRVIGDLQAKEAEVERLTSELAETNRGVLALYAELDEKNASLERASNYKSRFLSDMSHELRTPLNAVISLAGLLLDRTDGDLTPEQEKQITLIHKSAVALSEMVSDLLDLAKIEAGKVELHPNSVEVADSLSALRGIFRPLVPADGRVKLLVEEPQDIPPIYTDEGKLSQILRNLVSNALKFTEQGQVRVWTELDRSASMLEGSDERGVIRFYVADTGIGIAADDLPRIFEDFTQVDSPRQRRVRGTGLGLPISRKLARLLGGDVTVKSEPGAGSTFMLWLPLVNKDLSEEKPGFVAEPSSI